ncbi:MAG: aminotransferase DegT [Alteromonadaceae bacterium]|nr:MAG: aminotransferase DegT [Alteromonadaceae bacterium]
MISVCEPVLGEAEKANVMDCLAEGWISSGGPWVKRFEEEFSNYVECDFGISVSNGTAALEVALYALGVKAGDEVIIPSFNIISAALAVHRLGCKPVLVDVDPETWCMTADLVEQKITDKTAVILPVHMYGHPVDMDPIMALAKRHNLRVLEDAAEVHGAEYKGKKCGAIGDAAIFSFYANKLVTTGEGGMVVTSDETVAERARDYRNLCFGTGPRFNHVDIGYNFRFTSLQAAIGCGQLTRIEQIVDKKRELGEEYGRRLREIPGMQVQVEKDYAKAVYWMYCCVLGDEIDMPLDTVVAELKNAGIETRPFFVGMHKQKPFLDLGLFEGESYPVTDKLTERGFYLPSSLNLSMENLEFITKTLKDIICHGKALL